MTAAVTHSTAADGTFSAAGVTAWDAAHTITGLATVASTGAYSDLSGAPSLATVATTGAYTDLSARPTLVAYAPCGRLTLTTALPVTTADVTAATSVFYTPYKGDLLPIYSGSAWSMTAFTELTLALDLTAAHTGYQQSGKNFDLFVVNDAGTIRLGTGPAWTSDTGRGTGAGTTQLSMLNGILTNAVSMTLRFGSASGNTITAAVNTATYVGTMRASADGQCEDSVANRYLWNCYNRAKRNMKVIEAANTWTWSTASFHIANANAANQLNYVCGLVEDEVVATAIGMATTSGAAVGVSAGVGVDSLTATGAPQLLICPGVNSTNAINQGGWYQGFPGLGYHYLAWLEKGAGSGTQTWYGDNGGTNLQSGIIATVIA